MEFVNSGNFVKCLLGLGIGSFVWEHIARKRDSNIKPSVGIAWCSKQSKAFFNCIGSFLAKLSSFYTYINLSDFLQTAHDISKPTMSLLWSPYQLIKGYCTTALTYSSKTYLVGFGSLTLLTILTYVWYLYGHHCNDYVFWPFSMLPLKNLSDVLLIQD